MNTHLDCIPCLLRQALDAARRVTEDTSAHERILRDVLRSFAGMDLSAPPPKMAQQIHRRLRELSGAKDPYREAKRQHNLAALQLLPRLRAQITAASDPLETALRIAAAANLIDLGAKSGWAETDALAEVEQAMAHPLYGEVEAFRSALRAARRVLFLADNAGEIVFDRLLIEQMAPAHVTVAVRGAPVINDATRTDAETAGLPEVAEVIDNGSDAPGTLLNDCSADFRRRFSESDLVLAKGQGNYETLCDGPRDIFFLFRIKCSITAAMTGRPVGTQILARSRAGGG